MLYVAQPCPICTTGHVAFCRCADNARIALMCVCCESLWDAPEPLEAASAHFPPHAANTGAATCWASQVEIELRGWLDLIAGELLLQA